MGRKLYMTPGVVAHRAWGRRIDEAFTQRAGKPRQLRGAELLAYAEQLGAKLTPARAYVQAKRFKGPRGRFV